MGRVKWTNSLLVPPAPHILQLMGAASQIPALARKIANGFNHPPAYSPWWFDPAEAANMIKRMAAITKRFGTEVSSAPLGK